MNLSEKFRVNVPKVVHEMIEGEVIIVNLDGGDYYSLVKAGAEIWDGLASGLSKGEIVEEMVNRYEGDRETIETAVNHLIEELQREALIIVDPKNGAVQSNKTHENSSNGSEKPSFEPPTLSKYTDMEELLALDPIHEVDQEVGWPSAKS